MKKYIAGLFIAAAGFTACDSYTDIHQEYLEGGEIVYLQKVDSVATYAGYERLGIKLWYTNGDRLSETVIYYNNNADSIVINLEDKLKVGKDSLELIVSLPETNYNFEIVNHNSFNQKSLAVPHFASSYGTMYQETLRNRLLKSYSILEDEEGFEIEFFTPAESYTKVELEYNSATGKKSVFVNSESKVVIDEIPADSKFRYRTYYLPEEEAIDEIACSWSSEIELIAVPEAE